MSEFDGRRVIFKRSETLDRAAEPVDRSATCVKASSAIKRLTPS